MQTDAYLLSCCRYIELNPVRAGMVANPADYPWSSYLARMATAPERNWLDLDPCFTALGATGEEQRRRYDEFVRQSIPPGEWSLIRGALQRGQLTGTSRFIDEIERVTGIRIELRGRGRPKLE